MSYTENTVKSQGTVTRTDSNPLTELVRKSGNDKVVYHDAEGWIAGREVDLREDLRKSGWQEAFDRFDEEVSKGADILEASRTVRKAFNTGDVSLPIFVSDNLFISDSKVTPLADLMPRVAVDETTVKVDEISDVGDASTFAEGGTIPENDDVTKTHSYDVFDVGRKNEVSDKIQIARPSLSPVSRTQQLQVEAIRRYEEAQIIMGNDTDGDAALYNDTSGWKGFRDLVPAAQLYTGDDGSNGGTAGDGTGDTPASLSKVRDLLVDLRENGGNYSDMIVVTDFVSFRNVKEDLQQRARFDAQDQDELAYGYTALTIDGVQILESHGCPQQTDKRQMWAFDASAHFLAVLADVTLKPLSPTDTGTKFATYAHEVFVSRAPSRIAGYHYLSDA